MNDTEKKSTWGGARRSGVTKEKITISIDREIADQLPDGKSKLINELLKKYFSGAKN